MLPVNYNYFIYKENHFLLPCLHSFPSHHGLRRYRDQPPFQKSFCQNKAEDPNKQQQFLPCLLRHNKEYRREKANEQESLNAHYFFDAKVEGLCIEQFHQIDVAILFFYQNFLHKEQ